MENTLNSLTLWLGTHQELILITILSVSFLESLAVVGIIMPGIALLFAAAAAGGATDMPLWWLLAAGSLGAIAGDSLSFLLGYHFHDQLRNIPPFKTRPHWIEKGERFINQYGLMGIVLGRFIGPIRPFMPIVAGAMQMRQRNFLAVDIASGLAWSPFYLLPGYLVGASLEGHYALTPAHLGYLLGTLLFAWLLAQLIWRVSLQLRQRRNKLHLTLALAGACAGSFLALSQIMQLPSVIYWNQYLALSILSLRHPWLDPFFIALTTLGDAWPMVLWATSVTCALVLQRNWYACALWIGFTSSANGLLHLFKYGFSWARPSLIETLPVSYAYPSGHTTMPLIFFGILLSFCLPGIRWRRQKATLTSVVVLALFVASSRIYLTVHWITDILGGILLAGLVLALFYAVVLHFPFRRIQPIPIVIASVSAWLITFAVWFAPNLEQLARQFEPIVNTLN